MLESLMSLESPCHFHAWSFYTRLWHFYLVSCFDKGSVYIVICRNKLYIQEYQNSYKDVFKVNKLENWAGYLTD